MPITNNLDIRPLGLGLVSTKQTFLHRAAFDGYGLTPQFRRLKRELRLLISQRPRTERHGTKSKTWPHLPMTGLDQPAATALPREHWAVVSP